MSEAGTLPGPKDSLLFSADSVELLAAKNATLRLRAANGHIYSFTDLTSGQGSVNFGHLNPAIDPSATLTSDLAPPFFPPSGALFARWLCRKLQLDDHSLLFRVGAQAALAAALGAAQRVRPGKILTVEGSSHALPWEFAGRVVSVAPGATFTAWEDVSCLLYEPIQAANGYIALPLPWLRGLTTIAHSARVCVIADEIACGFHRFGKLSLAASEFLHPDIFLFGNSLTNGVYPLAVAVVPSGMNFDRTGDWFDPSLQVATLGFRAAEEVARYIDATDIESLVAAIFATLSQSVEKLAANPALSAFHLAGPTLSFEVRNRRSIELELACRARGVLIAAGADGCRVKLAPPLSVPRYQLANALKTVEEAASVLPVRSQPIR